VSQIDETVDVVVPPLVAYEQWVRFDEYPTFIENVVSVTRAGDRLRWIVKLGLGEREWESRIVADDAGRRIAWVAPEGPIDTDIRFEPIADGETRVRFRERIHDSLALQAATALGVASRRARSDLQRYKALVESRYARASASAESRADGS
jgi:uncharacterized membrane protein